MKNKLTPLENKFNDFYNKVFSLLEDIEDVEIRQELKIVFADVAFDWLEFERRFEELEKKGDIK